MSPLLIALLGVLLVPLFVTTWRTTLFGLALQGFLMAWIAQRINPESASIGDWLTMLDLVVVRGLWAPIALYGALRAQQASERGDVIPPNLLSWTIALGMVLAAFSFADALDVGGGDDQQTLVAVATAAVLLGLLLLATQPGPFSQMVGAIRIENGIALFELGGDHHRQAIGIQIAQIVIVVVTISLFRWYLKALHTIPPAGPGPGQEQPTL
ncbi:MAG: hycX [Deltaproteobacteria bacterium]|nr:hycX [Deltaproteobacteria bacterium]